MINNNSLRKRNKQLNALNHAPDAERAYFAIAELAQRWRVSRATVYNRLRSIGAEVLDFAPPGKRGKKAIAADTVRQIEAKKTKRLA
jgi:Fic family protein